MSAWYWRVIALKAVFALTCFVSSLRADDTVQKLPFCNPTTSKETPNFNDLLIVSTLDGKISAFATENGIKAWDLETQPLLSSNLHNVELTSDGKWVRLVPSLRGTLYSLSGDSIEPLPFSAEQLLSSSFKYSDDMVIAGARETLWLGVEAQSGSVIYECSSSGCNSEQQTAGAGRDMIVLRRYSTTVRALDPRSGSEKWNFSVAEHQLTLSRRECHDKSKPRVVAVAVALPDGEVVVKDPETKMAIWQQKLEAPVVNMWRLQGGLLENLDVLLEASQALVEVNAPAYPSLYLGIHNTQLYIQESAIYAQKLETAVVTKPIPWKLKKSRPLLTDGSTALTTVDEDNSLSVVSIPGKIGNTENKGFFLYLQDTCDKSLQVDEEMIPDIVAPNSSGDTTHHHVHVHVYSLWFWWKEVLVIAVSSALLLNLLIWPRFFPPKQLAPVPRKKREFVVVRHTHFEQKPSNEYSGRYENDFTTLKYLGKGGFGVVFEARNKIDHCSYAVKRITLPRRESQRERVLREVRALAKLEHEHIVRYFNAWVEEPPPHWQEMRDKQLMHDLGGVSLVMSDDYTSPTSPPAYNVMSKPTNCDVMLNLQKSIDMEYEKKLPEPRRLRSQSCNDSFTVEFDDEASKPHLTSESSRRGDVTSTISKHAAADNDDSFIVFANSNAEHSGLSEARRDVSNRILEKIKESEGYRTSSVVSRSRKKKGHTRHWSLDMVVNSEHSKMYLYIQMQLCKRDSLHDWLRNNSTWDSRRNMVKPLFSQIVSAVEYVHKAGLIHRDLKPRNIFFALDGKVKVGDFGLVTTMTDNTTDTPTELNTNALHTHKVGTHLYMSPEQLQGRSYSYKVDIFSLGLVLFEMLHPFGTDTERIKCLMNARCGKYPQDFVSDYPNETEVLKLMLSEDPNQRPTARGVRARAPLYHCTDEHVTQKTHYGVNLP
ncbi:unnamed protein product [Danaus chrysippus]|uniref:non-specific serine/threonine protein kinase n=2 Tax=Danaus chrysippus TaxID=151541 RepID=A0A8J2W4V9_9NEOP|nr:unnamed protein product [Danaus chrysippus]